MTPTGNSQYYRARCGIVVYSHLTGCGGADLGRHCGGSPCLSHCSPSAHESPQDCPKPVILPLYTHAHVKVIQTNRASRTDTLTSTPSSPCKHTTQNANTERGQTHLQTHFTFYKQAKKRQIPKITPNVDKQKMSRQETQITHTNTQNYLTPSTCCIAHTCSKTRETAVHGINTRSGESHFKKVSVDDE